MLTFIKWLGIPWTVVALLGTATAFIVGLRYQLRENRAWGTTSKAYNAELAKYLPDSELRQILATGKGLPVDQLNEAVTGVIKGHMVWLVIPFSVLIPNDVPISQMSRAAEIDLRGMLGEANLPPPLEARNRIVL